MDAACQLIIFSCLPIALLSPFALVHTTDFDNMRYESSRDDSIGAPNSRRSRRSSTPPATAQHLIRAAHVGLIRSVLTAVRAHLLVQTAAAWPDRSSPCRGKPQSPTLPSSHQCTLSRTRRCRRSPSARHHPASVHLSFHIK